jgi:hypothetical protein
MAISAGVHLRVPIETAINLAQPRNQLTILTLKKTQSKRPCQTARNWEIGFPSSILLSRPGLELTGEFDKKPEQRMTEEIAGNGEEGDRIKR